MNNLFHFISVMLIVSPGLAYFLSDNSQKTGYVAVSNARGFTRTGRRAMQRKHFSSSNHHNLDNIVDSHFKVMKSSSYLLSPVARNTIKREDKDHAVGLITESPLKRSRNANTAQAYPRNESDSLWNNKKETEMHSQDQRLNARQNRLNPDHGPAALTPNYQSKYLGKEMKSNFVKVNVHKTPISTDPQKVLRITNHHNNSPNNAVYQSVYPPDTHVHQNNTTTVEKHQPSGFDEGTSGIIKDLTEATGRYTANKNNGIEHEKWESFYGRHYNRVNSKRSSTSDAMKKYFVNKDRQINVERKGNKEYSRIGSHEDSIQSRDNPYAIFYRTHPEFHALDKQEPFVPSDWLDEYANIISTRKIKRLAEKYTKGVVDFKESSPYKDNLTKKIKIYQKLKNYRRGTN